jgi:L-ascorbate metabolism protein UlaG (beta-lactamase superfamily)
MTFITISRLCNNGYKLVVFTIFFSLFSCDNNTDVDPVTLHPISHATFILEYKKMVIYVDPVGGIQSFEGQKSPEVILITDIHGDHLNIETLRAFSSSNPKIIAPLAVAERLPDELKANLSVVSNFQTINLKHNKVKLTIEAIPMYNLREEALAFHVKDRGNGYVLSIAGQRIYISGDTEDIPEMRSLEQIDKAFVCMNLPWTMGIEAASDAVLEFKPKQVYPYHYKGNNGFSDVEKFKSTIEENSDHIEVRLLKWY